MNSAAVSILPAFQTGVQPFFTTFELPLHSMTAFAATESTSADAMLLSTSPSYNAKGVLDDDEDDLEDEDTDLKDDDLDDEDDDLEDDEDEELEDEDDDDLEDDDEDEDYDDDIDLDDDDDEDEDDDDEQLVSATAGKCHRRSLRWHLSFCEGANGIVALWSSDRSQKNGSTRQSPAVPVQTQARSPNRCPVQRAGRCPARGRASVL
jgi:hypothetical protein